MGNETNTNSELAVKIYTDLKTALPATIQWNFEELKAALNDALAPLSNLVLSPDAEGIKFAKGKRADINKMMNLILEARVETKKKFLAPFEDFEARANELISMCRTASGQFDTFVKDCEAKIKEKKANGIAEYIKKRVAETFGADSEYAKSAHWVKFQSDNPKWLNLTYKNTEIRNEIESHLTACKAAVDNINNLFASDGEVCEKALIEVCKDFDMNRVIANITAYKEEQKRIREAAERRNAEAAAREKAKADAMEAAKARLAEARENIPTAPAPEPAQNTAPVVAAAPAAAPVAQSEDKSYTFCLKFTSEPAKIAAMFAKVNELGLSADTCQINLTAKKSVLRQFREWLDANGIKYGNCAK